MSNSPDKELIEKIQKMNIEERRQRQFMQLKAWDLGKSTPLECIEAIINLEKIIFLGNKIQLLKRGNHG